MSPAAVVTGALRTLCMLGNFACFSMVRNTIRASNSLDPDQEHFVGSDLGPNCLQRLSADDKSHHLREKS